MSKKLSRRRVQAAIHFVTQEDDGSVDGNWYVYLLSSQDCTAFKVGFSCNPLRRLYSFNRRYYERFNLSASLLLRVDSERQARVIEEELKAQLSAAQCACPDWVSSEAGGETEWFSAVEFSDAVETLRTIAVDDAGRLSAADDYIRDRLKRSCGEFEFWASDYARRLQNDAEAMRLGYPRAVAAEPLRDWLDAYRFFDVPLFGSDAATLSFVTASARAAW